MGHYGRYLTPYFNDRRRGKERRKFSYTTHIPELRTGEDRRSGLERRKTPRQQIGESKYPGPEGQALGYPWKG